jgi:Eukaryotic aspartyl protease
LIVGSPTDVQTFYNQIPGSKNASSTVGPGYWTGQCLHHLTIVWPISYWGDFVVPCASIPIVSFTYGGQAWNISPTLFNLGQVSSGSPDCVGGIMSLKNGKVLSLSLTRRPMMFELTSCLFLVNFWIVGDVFLQNVYTIFDISVPQVGFAALA